MNSKQLLIFLIIVLAVILVVWQLFLPAFNDVYQAREDLKLWKDKVSGTTSLTQKLAELKKKYDTLMEQTEKIEIALPRGQDVPALLIELEALTSQNGLILNSVKFVSFEGAKKKKAAESEMNQGAASALMAGVKSMDIELNLSGDYNSLKNFLKAVESNLRIMDISVINFGSSAGSGEISKISGLATLIVVLNAYYR